MKIRYINTKQEFFYIPNPKTNLKDQIEGIKAIGQVINEGDTENSGQVTSEFITSAAISPLLF